MCCVMENKTLNSLIEKYNVAAPRYTSYPTVPFWDQSNFEAASWKSRLQHTFLTTEKEGISLYIHLPYCESLCTYCGCNTRITKNHAVEVPYITTILKEWTLYKELFQGRKPLIREIHLGGGTPTFFTAENLENLIAGLIANTVVAPDASFSFEAHPANTTYAHLETLYKLGFKRLSLGIQDFDPHVQYIINRKQDVADVERVMQEAREIGYTSINFDLIYGLPKQTLNSVISTIEQSMRLNPDRISFYSYAHVPWLKPGQRRFTEFDLPEGKDKLNLYKVGKELILDAGFQEVGMDHFAKVDDELFKASEAGTLHRNFMGYADRYTPLLIGLGVSSISDAWTAFAQNAKTVESYTALVDAGEIPVIKGHLLTEEDQLIRRYILDMMCRGKVSLIPQSPITAQILARLQPYLLDGLISMEGEQISLTILGKSFLRNVCTAFDQRLHSNHAQQQLFSQAI